MNENRIDIMLNAQIKYTEKLWAEKEELQQRIDKAIEYIKQDGIYFEEERDNLLEILGDKGNE